MPYKDPIKRKEFKHNYYLLHKEENQKRLKKYYQKNKEKIKTRSRLWKINNRERYRELKRNWNKNNKEKHRRFNQIYNNNHPDRIKARQIANNKLKHLRKPGFVFHHEDYSKPLDIKIIPIEEHFEIHRHRSILS